MSIKQDVHGDVFDGCATDRLALLSRLRDPMAVNVLQGLQVSLHFKTIILFMYWIIIVFCKIKCINFSP